MNQSELTLGRDVTLASPDGKLYKENLLYVSTEQNIIFTQSHDLLETFMYFNVETVAPWCWTCYVDGGNEDTWSLVQYPE